MLPTPGPTMVVPPYLRASLALLWISDTYAEWYIEKNIWWHKEKTWYLQKQWALHSRLSNKVTTLTDGPSQWAESTRSFTVQTKEQKKNGWWVLSRERCMNHDMASFDIPLFCDILHWPKWMTWQIGKSLRYSPLSWHGRFPAWNSIRIVHNKGPFCTTSMCQIIKQKPQPWQISLETNKTNIPNLQGRGIALNFTPWSIWTPKYALRVLEVLSFWFLVSLGNIQKSKVHQTSNLSLKVLPDLPASNRTSQTALSEKQVMTISSHNLGIRNLKLNRHFNGVTDGYGAPLPLSHGEIMPSSGWAVASAIRR